MNLFKSLLAFLFVFVSTLFTASDAQAFALGNHVGGFFLGTLDHAEQNDLGTRDTCWENGWLSYDTTSGYCVATKTADDVPIGSFNITEQGFKGYPKGVSRPEGPFRLLDGDDYNAARKAANKANNKIRVDNGLRGQPVDVHEIKPVKFDGSPTDSANKVILDRNLHRQQVTPWWNQLQKDLTSGGGG